jgi:hypothetical protein
MKKLLTVALFSFACMQVFAQGFVGTIEFRYTTQKDTTLNVYSVKNQKIRLDQYNKRDKAVEGSFLFDLAAKEIKFLNPKRKLWGFQKSETPQVVRGECVVSKTGSTKVIAGYKCQEYVVKNSAENTVVTYWITEGKFEFFTSLVKLWNRKDKQSIYFLQIKDLPAGVMPLLSEEKQLTDGKLLTRLEVVKIGQAAPADALLDVPAGYQKFDQQ